MSGTRRWGRCKGELFYCQNLRLLKQLAVYQFTSFKENKPKPTNHHAPGHGHTTLTQHISHVPHISQVSHISLPLFHLSHTPTVPFSLAKVTSWNQGLPFIKSYLSLTHIHVHPNPGSGNLLGRFIQVKNQLICLQSYLVRSVLYPNHHEDQCKEGREKNEQ